MSKVFQKFLQNNQENNTKGIKNLQMNRPFGPENIEGDVGIELEIEGKNLLSSGMLDGVKADRSKAVWHAKLDGSLRNGGVEYVLNKPCFIDEVAPLLSEFFARFDSSSKTKIENSNRCSTHVHINISDLKVNEITSLIALWTMFEEPLIKWWGIERYRNHFCLSSKDEDGTTEAWHEFLAQGKIPTNRGLKYSALNILPIWSFGSIEIRVGGGVDNADIPSKWINFLHSLKTYSVASYQSPFQIAYDLSERGALAIFEDICEQHGNLEFCEQVKQTVEDFNGACIESFRNAQPFVMGFPWDDWLVEINKEYIPNPFSSRAKKPKRAVEAEWLGEAGEVTPRRTARIEERTIFVNPGEITRLWAQTRNNDTTATGDDD